MTRMDAAEMKYVPVTVVRSFEARTADGRTHQVCCGVALSRMAGVVAYKPTADAVRGVCCHGAV